MITKENFKQVLEILGFKQSDNIYIKKYSEFYTELRVDLKKEELIYPEKDGLIVNDKTTSNFSSAENFVVFECVDRLLSQGYNPKHIELEPKWQVGHGASGGKADILIKDNNEKTLLIIECKTAGKEFKNAWDSTQSKPTQLFSYAQQDKDCKFIALYATDFIDNKLESDYYLIKLSDDKKLLYENPSFKSYESSNKVEDIYEVWTDSYKKEFKTNGIFENNKAYFIGVEKTTLNDLDIVSSSDIQGKYNEFATIMRQHNIGGAERAFNILVNLFLCKIIDEKQSEDNNSELKFYWKGISYDNAFALQDRLQELYKIGMDKFLKEEIIYISDTTIDDMFRALDIPSIKRDVKKRFREQKFFTNNDFTFLDVHSEMLFYKNFEVLLKVVKMFQDIKITGFEDNQFLGDMFEGFLDNGVKQSEGQFFTPMPIVKFITNSLPLDRIKKEEEDIKVIDYACGSGHFLNEVAKTFKDDEVIGIEKEYRLSKVAKVSALMYGQENINIVYGDALKKNEQIEENSFSVLVANPPYSVKGFLETLNKEDRERFELIKNVSSKSYSTNDGIECFFLERTKQLMKQNAVASIIIKDSILTDSSKLYISAREILLKNFVIIAIAKFGSGTFGKTGIGTVSFFLKRKNDVINIEERYEDLTESIFNGDIEAQSKYKDKKLLEKYCLYIGIDMSIYIMLLKDKIDEKLFKNETFAEYQSNYSKIKSTRQSLIAYIKTIEKDKFYYFTLAYSNKKDVIIVKSPSDNKENKKFLGYEWSGRKGNEGIQYKGGTLGQIDTPLYNPSDIYDGTKINTLISQNFSDEEVVIPQELEKFVSKSRLLDMLDFSRRDFNKAVSLNPKRIVEIIGKKEWQVKLGDVTDIQKGKVITLEDTIKGTIKVVAGGLDFAYYHNQSNRPKNTITVSASGANAGFVNIWKDEIYASDCTTIISNNKTTQLYLFNFLKMIQQDIFNLARGSAQPHVYPSDIKNIKIPLPPLNIQKEIVKECQIIDDEVERENLNINRFQVEIENYFNDISSKADTKYRLSNSENFDIFIGRRIVQKDIEFQNSGVPIYSANVFNIFGYTKKEFIKDFEIASVLWGIDGDWLVNYMPENRPFHPTDHCGVIRVMTDKINPHYLTWALREEGKRVGFTRTHRASTQRIKALTIESPSIEIQNEIILKIQILEAKITQSKLIVESASDRKQEVLRRYL